MSIFKSIRTFLLGPRLTPMAVGGPIANFLTVVPHDRLLDLERGAERGNIRYRQPSGCLMGIAGDHNYTAGRALHEQSLEAEVEFNTWGYPALCEPIRNRWNSPQGDAGRNARLLPVVRREMERRGMRVVTTVKEGELVAK